MEATAVARPLDAFGKVGASAHATAAQQSTITFASFNQCQGRHGDAPQRLALVGYARKGNGSVKGVFDVLHGRGNPRRDGFGDVDPIEVHTSLFGHSCVNRRHFVAGFRSNLGGLFTGEFHVDGLQDHVQFGLNPR